MSIECIRLGKTGMKVTRLGFGGIPIQRLDRNRAVEVVSRCLDLGINFLDTANGYSTSEERIGLAIAGLREKVFIASKTTTQTPGMMRKNLLLSLERLKTDYIDLYQFHNVSDFKTLDRIVGEERLLTFMEEAKKEGLIRHIGITSHQIDVAKKAVQSGLFETLMFPFNFLVPEAADVLLPVCKEKDVGFIAMKPLAGGLVENATVCIKYLMRFPQVVFIPGIEKIYEIDEIYGVIQGTSDMTETDLRQMEQIKLELGPGFCHRCDYCQPCTAGIPISMVLPLKSFFKRSPPETFFGQLAGPAMEKASGCVDCGECEERCPYHLPIRKMISEQIEWYEQEKKKYLQRKGRQQQA
ncbi:MAG: aldo/keto reductase [Dehalococcoidales bacterium]|nr:aldo/keto reductase [Dehalococcoidales bacterium]